MFSTHPLPQVHLETFLRELFHKDHRQSGLPVIRAVVVAPRDPDYEVLNLVAHPAFSDRIVYTLARVLAAVVCL